MFCKKCVSKQRKLNLAAQPDPVRGQLARVCVRCFVSWNGRWDIGWDSALGGAT